MVFGIHGAVFGSFATRVPWIAEHVHATPGLLGAALVAPAIGSISSLPWGARVIQRYGGRGVMRVLLLAWCLALVLPALAPNVPLLAAALLFYGAAAGLSDVAMNAQGVAVEARYGRSIMSGLHGMWSAGGLVASAVGAAMARAGVDARVHFGLAAAVLAVAGWFACAWLGPERLPGDDAPALAIPSRAIVLIGLVGLCGVFAEVGASDWSALFLSDVTGADPGTAAAAFTAFAFAMAAGRLLGDRVVHRLGAVAAVRAGGAVATTGGLLVVVAPAPYVAIVGFALIGIGISVVVPLVFAAAGKALANPAQAIAGVATIVYGSGLGAPAAIGGIAQLTSLRVSFAVVAAICLAICVGAGVLRPRVADPEATLESVG
jgi:MFS family permease